MSQYFWCNKCNGTFDPAHTYCPNCDGNEVESLRAGLAVCREALTAIEAYANKHLPIDGLEKKAIGELARAALAARMDESRINSE